MRCKFCSGDCIKNGFQCNGSQRYRCKTCRKRQQLSYCYTACKADINQQIIMLTKEGLGVRSTARVLQISTTTLLKRILAIARQIRQPIISKGKIYEVDEMRTFIGRKDKPAWIVYALERNTKKVVGFSVGPRTNKTLYAVIKTLELSEAKTIYTDGLKHYKYLIHPDVHNTQRYGTNHIERSNLTLRTHLRRLNRRTICFSKSRVMLTAILKIYFWI
jgi:insertion element IS1 protein InsB